MDVSLAIGIAGLALSVASLAYAVYVRRKSNFEKRLVYEVMPPVPVAEVIKGAGTYSLRVVYKPRNDAPVYVENAYMQLVRFTNFGKIPITKGDLARTDPLRIEVQNGVVLDISLSSETRNVCRIELGAPSKSQDAVAVEINFEFLDYLDGGLVQILSDSKDLKTRLRGTVVGMPEGIQEAAVFSGPVEVPNWGCAIGVLIEMAALVSVPLVFRQATGGWNNVWLLALPIVAAVVPLVLFILILVIVSPRDKFKFPKQLIPPQWYQLGGGWHYPPYQERAMKEKAKLAAEIDELERRLGEARIGK